jgi:phospholipase/lecithinase/hemolysin
MRIRWSLACALVVVLASGSAPAARAAVLPAVSAVYAFGDSLSDAGNVYWLTRLPGPVGDAVPDFPIPPYFDGRFSNGYNFVDRLSQRLAGAATMPSLAGGTNYAVGGATTGLANVALPPIEGLPPQGMLAQYAAYASQAGQADPDALYVVFGGANDLFALARGLPALDPASWAAVTQQTIGTSTANLASIVGGLVGLGARHVLVPNLPDLGLTPTLSGTGLEPLASNVTQAFNQALDARLNAIASAGVVQLDLYALFQSVVTQPDLYGLSEVGLPCYPEGLSGTASSPPCANADDYLFWDEMHPTARAHGLLAAAAVAALAVPEPRGEALLALALSLILVAARDQMRRPTGRQKKRQVLDLPLR